MTNTFWIFISTYIIPMIICILCVIKMYKKWCKKWCFTSTIQGLFKYNFNIILVSIIPIANIIFSIAFPLILVWDNIKYTRI